MPLKPGSSRETVSSNIKEMMKNGHSQAQSVAASLKNAGKSNKYARKLNMKHYCRCPRCTGT